MQFKTKHDQIITFIETLKGHRNYRGNDAHEIMEDIFMHGNCYKFASALKIAFPEVILQSAWKHRKDRRPDHIMVKLDDKYYDIQGEVDLEDWISINDMNEIEEAYAKAYCYSFKAGGAWNLRDDNNNIVEKIEGEQLIFV